MRWMVLALALTTGCGVAKGAGRVGLAIGTAGISELVIQDRGDQAALDRFAGVLGAEIAAGRMAPAEAAQLYLHALSLAEQKKANRTAMWGALMQASKPAPLPSTEHDYVLHPPGK